MSFLNPSMLDHGLFTVWEASITHVYIFNIEVRNTVDLADLIDAFNTTSRYLDAILNINNVYFDNMVSQIYPSELKLN